MKISQRIASLFWLPNEDNRYSAMEGLRAYAVIAVFLVHSLGAYYSTFEKVNLNKWRIDKLSEASDILTYYFFSSHYGVDLFFLLSGFLIFRMISRPNFSYGGFMKNRVIRIYPAFLLSLALAILAKYLIRGKLGMTFELDPWALLQNLFFLNGIPGNRSLVVYNHPTWSLFFEFTFYLALPVMVYGLKINNRKRLVAAIIAWLVLCQFVHPHYARYVMFLAGALLATLHDNDLRALAASIPDAVVLPIYMLCTIYFMFEKKFVYFSPVYAVGSSLLFINAVFGSGFLNKVFVQTPMRYLGNISYSFYLVHATAISLCVHYLIKPMEMSGGALTLAALMVSSLILATALATLVFALVEKPYFNKK